MGVNDGDLPWYKETKSTLNKSNFRKIQREVIQLKSRCCIIYQDFFDTKHRWFALARIFGALY